ncbi:MULTISPECIES: hypothetical protein [unclassified Paenibacillus]|uniref:hypothetical protein n=1 Tax=unclassified Paenibacillus TaxID=185978 RepID=UPI00117DFEC5|nr:hypothetical protein [Paenibacillus sp. FSL H8-0259]
MLRTKEESSFNIAAMNVFNSVPSGNSVIVVYCAFKNSEKGCPHLITVFCTTKSARMGENQGPKAV